MQRRAGAMETADDERPTRNRLVSDGGIAPLIGVAAVLRWCVRAGGIVRASLSLDRTALFGW